MTSAGVYKKDGTLVRTLWSGVRYEAGTYSKTWDKKNDDGVAMPDGDYDIKVLSNNVQYVWEGVLGNTSTHFTGSTVFHEFERLNSMAITGGSAYFTSGYNEKQNAQFKIDLSVPNEKKAAAPRAHNGQEANFVATDGRYVYWAGKDPFATGYKVHYIYATKVSDNSEVDFGVNGVSTYTSLVGMRYMSLIDFIGDNASGTITGLAVQKTGNYLFVAHKLLNRIHILNKTTGARVAAVSISSPELLTVGADDNLWIQSGSTVRKYTVGTGTLVASSPSLTVADPVGVGISQDGGIIAIADASSQQVKAFYTATGSSAWTLGQAGGYSRDATVTDTKFFFGDSPHGPEKHTFIAFQSDGSFWVGDSKNLRVLRFAADRSRVLERIMYLPHSRSCSVDPNNPKKITSDFLEFEVDYSKPLAPNNGSWKLHKNWGYNITGHGSVNGNNLISTTTLSNGRTYSITHARSGSGFELVELPATGILRFTGILIGDNTRLYPDGSLRTISRFATGASTKFTKKTLTGFDATNNPVWSADNIIQSSPATTSDDPLYRNLVGHGLNPVPQTSTGLIIGYEGGGTYEGRYSTKWHLGALKDNKWLWKTAKGLPRSYTGDYPTDGSYDMGNGVVYPGGPLVNLERNIFWQYHGEFWKNGQTNKWQHVFDNGLLVGIFGATDVDIINGQKLGGEQAPAEMAGNTLSAGIVKVGEDYYIYHCDESIHGGVHRWKITGLNTIEENVIPIKTTAILSKVPSAPDLSADDVMNTLAAMHTLGTSEILVSENGGAYTAYTAQIKVGDNARAAGYYKFKIRASGDRPESAVIGSPAFTLPTLTAAAGYKLLPGKIEAENYDYNEKMYAEITNDVSGGKDMRYLDPGDWLDYKVFVPASGNYTFSTRVVSYYEGGGEFELRTESGTILQTITVPNTFTKQSYTTVHSTVFLGAGNQTLRLYIKKAGFSINWFEVVKPLTAAAGYKLLPGKIEAENYDVNKETRPVTCTDVGGGVYMGYIDTGDWLDYNVHVAAAGTYPLSIRIATPNNTGALEVRDASGAVLCTVAVPSTTGYENWISINTKITLPAGNQTLRLYMKSGGFNLNWFEVLDPTAAGAGFTPLPAKIEAENFNAKSGTYVGVCSDEGGGKDVTGTSAGYWLDYNVYVANAGTYVFKARVASDVGTGSFEIRTGSGTVLGSFNVPNTGGTQKWITMTTKVDLTAGNKTLRIYMKSSNFHLNWFEVAIPDVTAESYKPIPGIVEAEDYSDNLGFGRVNTLDVSGTSDMKFMQANDWLDYKVAVEKAGEYLLSMRTASLVSSGIVEVRSSDNTVLATVAIPSSASWGTYIKVTTKLTLPAGNQTLRLFTKAGGFTINRFEVIDPTTAATGFRSLPSRIEAEAFNLKNGMCGLNSSDAGGGKEMGCINTGNWLDYYVFSPSDTKYSINVRVASTSSTGAIEVRNASGSILATITVPNTGGWQNYKTVGATVSLPAGNQTLRLYVKSGGFNLNWFEALSTTTTTEPAAPTTPSITYVNLPSKVEAEAYANKYGMMEATCYDTGGGLVMGYISTGHWLDYNVNVSASGSYPFNIRVASPNSTSAIEVRNASGSILATITVPNTGGWQNYKTVGATVSLPAGNQTLRLYVKSGGFNLNWFEALSTTAKIDDNTSSDVTVPTVPSGYVAVPAKIEAEAFNAKNGMVVEACYDAGGGKAMGYIDTGHWLDYNVSVSEATTYVYSIRVASPYSGKAIEVRNASGAVLLTINIPNTGGWQRWVTVNTELALPAGNQTLRLYVKSGGFNLNWFEVAKLDFLPFASNGMQTTIGNWQESKELTVYPNPFNTTATVDFSISKGEAARVELYTMQGILVETLFNSVSKNDFTNRVTINGSKYANGVYIVKLTAGKQIQYKKVVLQK